MRAVRTKAWKREIRRANRANWERFITGIAMWPLRQRIRFAWVVLFPPKKYRKSAGERKVLAARKKMRVKKKAART